MNFRVLVDDLVQLRLIARMNGYVLEHVLSYKANNSTGGGAQASDIIAAWITANMTTMMDSVSVAATMESLTLNKVNAAGKLLLPPYTALDATPGASVGDALPQQIAGLLSTVTAVVGRSGRGRLFLWPSGEGSNDAQGRPNTAYKTSVLAFATSLFTPISAGTLPDTTGLLFGVLSRKTSTFNAVTDAVIRPVWSQLRKRKEGVGI